jgi:hypothetical protein
MIDYGSRKGDHILAQLTGNSIARRGALFGGFDELRKAMRQHGNIDYANIWLESI